MALLIPGDQGQRFSLATVDFHLESALEARFVSFETLTQTTLQFLVAGFPDFIASMDAFEIDVAVAECDQDRRLRVSCFNLIDATALFFFVRVPSIEDNSITGLKWGLQFDRNSVALHALNFTEVNAALFSKSGMNEFLVVYALQPAGVKPAGEGHFHFIMRSAQFGMRSGGRARPNLLFCQLIECIPINPRNVGDVFRRFETALNL